MSDANLRQIFQDYIPDFFWQSIESGSTGSGIPDLYYCAAGPGRNEQPYYSGWIECKTTKANAVVISPFQVAWAERHWRKKGRCWLAVRVLCKKGKRTKAKDELWLFHGEGTSWCKVGGISAVPSLFVKGHWVGGPAKWDWQKIKSVLAS